jgi:2-amino-4-hydroxy-6-hydroxymethyldihydropteridine diphosphokinase
MKWQHQALIALGSNQGNRTEHIQNAIELIHRLVGTVTQVSKLYETPSWGYKGADYFNGVALVHTHKTAQEVLDGLLGIEREMGRARANHDGYTDRLIDLDLLTYDDEIIQENQLHVPHPRMQERNFVLVPMLDLKMEWQHPIFKKNAGQLLQASPDNSPSSPVARLQAPVQKLALDQLNYIAIEGNIGAGKTTLTHKIAEDFNAKMVLERFADNPFLPKFYEDQSRYAFPLEMSFLADRYQQITDDLSQFDLFKDFVVADYHIFKSLIFAKVTLTEDEFRLYKTMFSIIYKEMPKPDLYIYLYQSTERLLQNIKKRGRSYEQEIEPAYLERINSGYLDFIKSQTDIQVLVIDVTDLDFIARQEDYLYILRLIEEKMLPS